MLLQYSKWMFPKWQYCKPTLREEELRPLQRGSSPAFLCHASCHIATQQENGHCDQVNAGIMFSNSLVLNIMKQLKLYSLEITQSIVLGHSIKIRVSYV